MTLRPPIPGLTERICNFGVAGVGKSYDFYTIPRLATKRKADMRFFILDTDESAEMMLSDPDFADINLDNIHITHAYDWESFTEALANIQGKRGERGRYSGGLMKPDDWLFIDMLSPAWQWVQDWYTRKMFNKTLDQYFVDRKKANQKADTNPFESDQWQVMNTEYGTVSQRLLTGPGHLFVTADQKAIPKTADEVTRVEFGPIGFMPGGQKKTPHLFHSCFHKKMSIRDGGQYLISSAKNRSRPKLEGEVVKDFAMDVLRGNRGWKL